MKNNITKLYLFNIVIGFQTGLAAIGTVFQLLFSEVGGKELVTKLNQIDQYAIIISGVFIALNVMNIKI